jgi:hypothetical protein
VLDPESDISQSRRVGESSAIPRLVIDVLADAGPELEVEAAAADAEAEADADADANEEPALGGCGSGVMLVRSVSQVAPPSGLKLRSRSPSPSNRA